VFNADHEKIVVMAGGRYLGTSDGMVWFNGRDDNTLAVTEDGLCEESIRLRLAQDDAIWLTTAD